MSVPPPRTSFIGREQELREVQRLLDTARLLTLTGPGGVGKTRLALEAAAVVARTPTYRDGIWLAELAPLSDGALLVRAIAASLGIQQVPEQPLHETLLSWLRARHLLLVLDNCEHVIGDCAATADLLLRVSEVTILATSREALNVDGEVVWPVGPLPTDSDRLQLFADRALAANPAFALTTQNQSAVLRICHQLDGLPLAIELAAARVNAFTVEEIEQRLDQRFGLLTAGRRVAPQRHRTLRALVDWSYDLLAPDERWLLQQVSVFSGGWTLEAAEAVCESGLDVQAMLPSLVEKSLIQVEQAAERSRYRLMETLRHYAMDRLREAHGDGATRTRHLNWCERLSQAVEQEVLGPRQLQASQRLEAEVDNVRAALTWSRLEPTCLEAGLRLAASLARFWFHYGHGVECSEWLEKLLKHAPAGAARAEALSAAGFLYLRLGDPRAALPLLEEAAAHARQVGDRGLLTFSLLYLGELHVQRNDLPAAHAALEESLELTTQGAAPAYLPPYRVLYNLGELAEVEGDCDRAAALYERSLELARSQQDRFRNVVLRRLGQVAVDRGDLAAARDHLHEAVLVARDIGPQSWAIAPALSHLAYLARIEAQPERALRLAAAAIGLRERHQARLPATDAARLDDVIESARAALSDVAAAAAWAEGHALTADQAVAYAMDGASRNVSATRAAVALTPRELEVAALLARFATNPEIASRLQISERTAKRHVENMLFKLGLRSRVQVAAWANERGLVAPD